MKTILTTLLLCLTCICHAQTFYVHCEDKRSRELIEDKVKYDGYKISNEKENADFTLECPIRCTSKLNSMYKGYVSAINNTTGQEVARTQEVRRGAVAVNGYNASWNIFKVISKKYLPDLLAKCKTR